MTETTDTNNYLLSVENIDTYIGQFHILEGVSVNVAKGSITVLLGRNGAGKTTTVRMLTGLIRPSSGSAQVAGFELGEDDTNIRRNVGILTESPGMYERLTAEKNLTIFANLYDVPDIEKSVNKYLSMLNLWERRHDAVGSFSKGMRQKLAVARALIHEPQILFLDEPTTGLDPEASKTVRDFVEELKNEGRTIFMTTHNLDEADRLCDRVAVFKTRLLAMDTPARLRTEFFGRRVVFHLREAPTSLALEVSKLPFVRDAQAIENKLVVALDNPEEANPQLVRFLVARGVDVLFVGELRRSLQEVYLQLVKAA